MLKTNRNPHNVNWKKNDSLILAVATAWYLKKFRGNTNKGHLWNSMEKYFPDVSESILEVRISFKDLRTSVLVDQGLTINPNMVLQRADKAERNSEAEFFKIAVKNHFECTIDSCKSEKFTSKQWETSKEIYGEACVYCGRPFENGIRGQADHVIPLARGGVTEQFNCAPACVDCNRKKGTMQPWEFMRSLMLDQQRGRQDLSINV